MDYNQMNKKVRNPKSARNPKTPPKEIQKWENDGGGIVEAQQKKLSPPKTVWQKIKSLLKSESDFTKPATSRR